MSGAQGTWRMARLCEATSINPRDLGEKPTADAHITFVPMAAVEPMSGKLDPSRTRPWREVEKGYVRFKEGDVLFAKITPCMENGKAAIARGLHGGLGCGSTEFHVLRPLRGVLPEWLLHFVLRDGFRHDARAKMTGTAGQLRVPASFLQEQEIPLPSIDEQREIVAAIESHFSRLDTATATLERVQRNLERYRASVLKAAVEGRLVPTEAELAKKEGRSYEPASVLLKRILAERRRRWEELELAKLKAKGKPPIDDRWKARYEEPSAPDTTDLPELPEGWCWVSIDQVVESGPQNGLYVPKSAYGHGVPIVRVDDYQDQFSRGASELLRVNIENGLATTYGLAVGDLLVNRVNSPTHLGKSLIVQGRHLPAVFESNIMRMRIARGVPPNFVHYYLCSLEGRRRLLGKAKWAVNQASINQQDVLATSLPLPPADEAARIAVAIEELASAKASAQATIGASRRHLARLRQSILKWAFEGRLVSPDDDEAAGAVARR